MKKNKNQKISLITVVLNDEKNLQKTINSIASQSYKNYEYIIIDGKSTDKTLSIIKKNKKYVSYFSSQKDRGLYDAMNKGLKKSTGDIIGIINSGDIYYKNTLKYVNNYFNKNQEIDFLFGPVKKHWGILSEFKPWKIFYTWFFYTSHSTGFFITKKAMKKNGKYNLKYKYSSDFDYFYRMIVHNKMKGAMADKKKIFGYFRPGGISSKLDYWTHFYEKFVIRKDNKQNRFFLILLIFTKLIRDIRFIKKIDYNKFHNFIIYILCK
jgi:glycosyltransferase involved in cell wall biosynthesis